jgi:hypothetical protein
MHRNLWGIATDKRLWSGPALFVIILLVAVNFLVRSYKVWLLQEEQKAAQGSAPQHVLLAGETSPRYDLSCGEHLDDYWPSIPDARRTGLAILSGMSQMHSINDPRPGDQLICQWLDDALAPKGTRVWGFAAPNLCNEEAVFQLTSLIADPATKPSTFIYGLCFDKMRNVDLRPGYEQFLRRRPAFQDAYEAIAHRYSDRYPAASAKMLQSLQQLRQTSQQKDRSFESRLRQRTEEFVPLVASRKDLNSQAQLKLFALRNKLLNIKPTSKRPMIQSRFDMNWQFLQMLTGLARENGVQVIFYIIPLNPQGDNPYIPAEYAAFKERCQNFCSQQNIPFANFENIVPADDWGFYLDGPDFKHFRGPGHKITAAAIIERFGPQLTAAAPQLSGAAR